MQPRPAHPPSSREVQSAVEEVLSQPEFQPDPFARMWQEAFRWVRDFLLGLGDWAEAHPTGRWILAAALTIVLLALLAHIAYTLARVFKRPPERKSLGLATSHWRALEGQAKTWGEALGKARAALRRGDLYQAVWITHRMLLGLLDERGLLQFAKWKTNTDYLRECRAQGRPRELLERLSQAYEDIVYAHRSFAASRLEGLLAKLDELQRDLRFSN